MLLREPSGPHATLGRLLVDDEYECDTCEDRVREVPGRPVKEWKIQGETAIPAGRYRVLITFSGRFQRDLPELEAVPGFTGIRIHPGNTHADTEGCILVGKRMGPGTIVESRKAFAVLLEKIDRAIAAEEQVYIEVRAQ